MAVEPLIGNLRISTSISSTPTLLELPMALQQEIIRRLSDEALLTFRQTCKELPVASSHHFADRFLHLHCGMFSKQRWLRLEKMLSSQHGRLRSPGRACTLQMVEKH